MGHYFTRVKLSNKKATFGDGYIEYDEYGVFGENITGNELRGIHNLAADNSIKLNLKSETLLEVDDTLVQSIILGDLLLLDNTKWSSSSNLIEYSNEELSDLINRIGLLKDWLNVSYHENCQVWCY